MIYRGPGFLRGRMIWLHAHPLPNTSLSVSSIGDTQEDCERDTTCGRESGEAVGGRGAGSYDRKKAWSSINLFNTLWLKRKCHFLFRKHENIRGFPVNSVHHGVQNLLSISTARTPNHILFL
jgi:hypothetical protein